MAQTTTTILTLISGLVCLVASGFMLYVIKMDFIDKRHNLRMFQFGLFGILLMIGVLQVMNVFLLENVGFIPINYKNLYSIAFILLSVLLIPYFAYNKRRKRLHENT